MNCLVIQISSHDPTGYDEQSGAIVFSEQHYNRFWVARGISQELQKSVSIRCEICKSYLVSAAAVYEILQNLDDIFEQMELAELDEDFEDLSHTLYCLLAIITEEIDATDEEWEGYFLNNDPPLAPLHCDGYYVYIPEWASNPVRLRYEDVAFRFGINCPSCDRFFGESQPAVHSRILDCIVEQHKDDKHIFLAKLNAAGVISDDGLSLEEMAQEMLDEGWPIRAGADGKADPRHFIELLKDELNGKPVIHPDDIAEEDDEEDAIEPAE